MKFEQSKGFGQQKPPRFWLQVVYKGDRADLLKRVNNGNPKAKAIALLADSGVEFVLLLRGRADPHDVQQKDILADFQREWRPGTKRIQ